ncbi:phage tail protein [Streptomyces sp. NPDC002680]|uniref:phage tail protein n=1 Tax=Streptomyces sp. NPDC002680 TaxID=3364659 RepID=UPI0036743177
MANHTTDEVYDKTTSIEAKIDDLRNQLVSTKLLDSKITELKKAIEAGPTDKPTDVAAAGSNIPIFKEILLALKAANWGSLTIVLVALGLSAAALVVLVDDTRKVIGQVRDWTKSRKEKASSSKPSTPNTSGPALSAPKPADLTKTTGVVNTLKNAFAGLVSTVSRLLGPLNSANNFLGNYKGNANGAAAATDKVGSSAQKTAGQIKSNTAATQVATTTSNSLRNGLDQLEKTVTKSGKAVQTAGTNTAKYEAGANKAAKGQDKMNKSMKGNFFGMLMGLLAPLIQRIVDMATRSKTMQDILKKAFEVIKSVIDGVIKFIGPIMQKAAKLIKDVWDGIKKAIETVVKAVAKVIQTYFDIWKKVITTVLDAIKAVVSKVWNGIKSVIMPVVDWVKSAIPNAFQAVKDKLSDAWNGLKDIAGRAFDGIKNAVKAPINAVIGLINSAIGKLNSIRVSIPGWVPFVGGKTFGLSLPKIPTLATGGVVLPRSGGVPAILAEAGEAEAVLPLSKLDRMLRNAASQGRIGGDGATGAGGALRIENYYAASSSDPQRTADALMFLAKARGWRG